MSNTAQLRRLYWPEWNKAAKVLVSTGCHSKAEAEEVRKEIHLAITGSECSSKDLTNRQLDSVLARFRAISQPVAGAFQARQADQPLKRIRFRIAEVQARLALPDFYIDATARRIAKRPLDQCDERLLKKVLAAMVYHEKRQAPKS